MKKRSFAIWISVIWVIIAFLAIGGVTYAWFTFNPATNVVPISSTVSDGDISLLISTDPNGEFTTNCVLPQYVSGNLEPVSTANLERFYTANLQDRDGISVGFRECTSEVDEITIHGVIYLKSLKNQCAVYFNKSGMDFGNDPQVLAASRLGMKITSKEGTSTYIFSLNEFGNVAGAAGARTTAETNAVVASLNGDGTPYYVGDPARSVSDFFAVTGATKLPMAGRQMLCTIQAEEIVTVEYWLYLEGCDENCINEVQEKEGIIQLSFAGVSK